MGGPTMWGRARMPALVTAAALLLARQRRGAGGTA